MERTTESGQPLSSHSRPNDANRPRLESHEPRPDTDQARPDADQPRSGAEHSRADAVADARSGVDGTTRRAALWATVVAVPLTVLVAILVFGQLNPDPIDTPAPAPTSARPQSTTPVRMAAPPLPDRPATVCRALLSQLPGTLRGAGQRSVSAGSEQNAAWGDPAVTLACGVSKPVVPATADLWLVNGVCWLTETGDAGLVLTTVDREVSVRLTVPVGQEQTVTWAAPISETLIATVPGTPGAPSRCAD